ncbi:hypothetical protein BDW69DRAFT_190417 [Aspergillus filifer]
MSVRTDTESTPLQTRLEGLAVAIAKLGGGGASLLMFFILVFRFRANLPGDTRPAEEKASTFVDLLVVTIAIIAVAVPEGLPLTVTLALAFATTRLLKKNNLVRVLRACETMGNATCMCSDKTGTLFQITVNITAVILSFVTSMANDDMEPVLKTVQLLWAALALATDPPTDAILDRPPQPKSAPLISMNVRLPFYFGPYLILQMWKMIIVLYFAGDTILNYNTSIESESLQLDTIIFNVFVSIHRNWFFIAINANMIGLQIVIVFVGGRVFDITPGGLDGSHWAISVIIALFELPWECCCSVVSG